MNDLLVVNGISFDNSIDNDELIIDNYIKRVIFNDYTITNDILKKVLSMDELIFNNCEVLEDISLYFKCINVKDLIINNFINFDLNIINNKIYNNLFIEHMKVPSSFNIICNNLFIYNSVITDISFINNCKIKRLILNQNDYLKYKDYLNNINILVKSNESNTILYEVNNE